MSATPTSLVASDIEVGFAFDCRQGGAASVLARFDLETPTTNGVLAAPPTISIGIPSAVPCPSSVSLAATVGDPDDDLERVRWYVDDLLMASDPDADNVHAGTQRSHGRDRRARSRDNGDKDRDLPLTRDIGSGMPPMSTSTVPLRH